MNKKNILNILLLVIVLSSCSIQKRHYMPGFYTGFGKSKTSEIAKDKEIVVKDSIIKQDFYNEDFVASIDNELKVAKKDDVETFKNNLIKKIVECDEIKFKNGSVIKVKIVEVSDLEVKYKYCDIIDNTIITIKKSDVLHIKYAKGNATVLEKSNSTIKDNSNQKINTKKSKRESKFDSVLWDIGLVSFLCIAPILIGFIIALIAPINYIGFTIILGFVALAVILAFICIFGTLIKRAGKESLTGKKEENTGSAFFGWIGLISAMLSLLLAGKIPGYSNWAKIK